MKTKTYMKIGISIAVIATLIALYFMTPLREYLSIESVMELTKDVPEHWTTALIFLGIFFIGGALLVPIPLMAFAVSLVFNLWVSVLIAIPGFLIASLSGYTIGRVIDTEAFGKNVQKHVDAIKDKVEDKGAWAVLALRMAPTPPFTVTSIISGAIKINVWKYMLGSTLGIMPLGLSAIFFGRSAMEMMQEPSGLAISTLVAAIILLGVYVAIKHRSAEQQEA